ncbi:MAG: DMT family transporter [Endozoicomonas sp.]|uniref:DMT family transporter n=1 Tax=Endozoicomonas sp. TaxID=1892382 RepID=UPI003D9BD1B9
MKLFYYLFPLSAVIIWSGNNVVGKIAASEIAPESISFYRWALAALILTPFCYKATRRHWAVIKQHKLKLFILTLLGMVVYQSLSYVAAHSIPATNIGIILALTPLLTVLISVPVFGITITWGIVTGVLISFYGVIFFVSGGHPTALLNGFGKGEILMLVATLSYALYGVMVKYWKIPLPTWVFIYVQGTIAAITLFPFFLLGSTDPITSSSAPLIIYAGLLASILAPALWVIALDKLSAHNTAIFMNLMPVFTTSIAVVFLSEDLFGYHYLGGGLILAGVILSQMWHTPLKSSTLKAVTS